MNNKEMKEMEKLKKAQAFHKSKNYFWILILVLTVIYVVDELASNVRGTVDSYTICDLFNTTFGTREYDMASGQIGLITTACYLIYLVAPFYKSLADKYGRRIFLIINTIGMGVGMLLSIISHNVTLYLVGLVIMTFFTPNDMQVIYIMECAPKEHRAKLCSITKGIALLSVSLLGVMVNAFVDRNNPASWRKVYIIPIILAFVIGILAIFFVKETPTYTQKRLEYLSASEEERKAAEQKEKEAAKEEQKKSGGVIDAFKYIFTNKQTRAIAVVAVLFAFSTGYTGKYQNMIEAGIANNVLSGADSSTILMIYPLVNGVFTLIGGFITDALGRKKSALILGLWAALGLAGFAYACTSGMNAYLAAFCFGISIAGLWSISDMIYFVITSESTPTEKRASVVGTMQLMGMVGTGLNMVFNSVMTMIAGATNLPKVLTLAYLPLMTIALVIMMLKVKETKDVDLDNVEL
ncbi:MAG: MFS transporter [Erysipelotrichaceae bacterium]|nr:MFS transporter [Erysipelotrichaceae bacterium]